MEFEIDSDNLTYLNPENSESPLKVPLLSNTVTYNNFFRDFMLRNVPCIISGVTDTWAATTCWLKNSAPNLCYLRDQYGASDVTVYDCNERYFNSQKTQTCTFAEFLDSYWDTSDDSLKYLKDWHLQNTNPEDRFYEVPIFFASDWLNEFLAANHEDDYRFVYMGRRGTWTPFHADVFTSFSWSANVCGRKRWILIPPGEEHALKDNLSNLPYDVSELYQNLRHVEIIQNPGEVIFVPSNWYHQVWNLEDTISVNHNWINGCNIESVWKSLDCNLDKVKKEIDDCRDMEDFVQHCQIVLKASYGMDFFKFYDFIAFIATERLQFLKGGKGEMFHGHVLGRNHAVFDLKSIRSVLNKFLKHHDFEELFLGLPLNPQLLLDEITNLLD